MNILMPGASSLAWLDRLARWFVALVFVYAGIPKLFNIQEFAAIINAYALLPEFLLLPTAVVLPSLEIILAIGLFFNMEYCRIGPLLLLLLFIAILSYAISIGLDIDCGCFGPEDPEHRAFQGLRVALFRDIVMVVLLVLSHSYHRYYQGRSIINGE